MRVLELYSGIGGMHYAFKASGLEGGIVSAADINTIANEVYKHNFPSTRLLQRNIQSFSSKEINDLQVDMILMSPPCQPFTRVGLKKDVNDGRTSSFLHILEILPQLDKKLKYILIENVKGFEMSETRDQLVLALKSANFSYQEFLLSPNQFSVPNTRHRYYLIAKRMPLSFCFETNSLMENFPVELYDNCQRKEPLVERMMQLNSYHRSLALRDCDIKSERTEYVCYSVGEVLETDCSEQDYTLPDKILGKHGWLLDIVTPVSKRSCCFTKAYGHYVEGTGSVLCMESPKGIAEVFEKSKVFEPCSKEQLDLLNSLKLRYFTPKEISRLMCFPEKLFSFPDKITKKQKYRLLGNSINVHVVSLLIALVAFQDECS